jgi:DNA-binding protein H-NS
MIEWIRHGNSAYNCSALTKLNVSQRDFVPKLSAEALKARITALQQQLAEAEKNTAPAIKKVQALMKKLGVTIADLTGAGGAHPSPKDKKSPGEKKAASKSTKKSASPVPVKYRDETGNTWTGRGKTPRWLAEAKKAGQARESFKI